MLTLSSCSTVACGSYHFLWIKKMFKSFWEACHPHLLAPTPLSFWYQSFASLKHLSLYPCQMMSYHHYVPCSHNELQMMYLPTIGLQDSVQLPWSVAAVWGKFFPVIFVWHLNHYCKESNGCAFVSSHTCGKKKHLNNKSMKYACLFFPQELS